MGGEQFCCMILTRVFIQMRVQTTLSEIMAQQALKHYIPRFATILSFLHCPSITHYQPLFFLDVTLPIFSQYVLCQLEFLF